MNQRLLLLFVIAIFSTTIFAQEIVERDATMSLGVHNGFYLDFPGAEKKNVEKLWKNYLNEYAKKVKKKKNEMYTEEARVAIINGTSEITFYSELEEGRGQTTLNTWIDLGGVFLNSEDHPSQHEGLEQFLDDFFIIVQKDVIDRELKDEEDTFKDINKSLDRLIKKNENYHKEIKKAQDKIRKMEEEIEKNLRDQDDVKVELEKQKEKIEEVRKKYNRVGKTV